MSSKIKLYEKTRLKLPEGNSKTIFFEPTDIIEIQNIIKEMKNKSEAIDNLNTKIIKAISAYVSSPLEHIFNLCKVESIWPKALKTAVVVPIYKAGNRSCISNYRPISLLSNIAKILEKIICRKLNAFLRKYNIILDKQYGFVKNRGTTDALSHLTNIIYRNLGKSKPIIAVYLDLAKAFDTVNHEILLEKLERYGIRGNAWKLISGYLSNRTQKVKLQNHFSESKEIICGVPRNDTWTTVFYFIC